MADEVVVPYTYQAYPKWLFHATKPATLVLNPEQHGRLGAGWLEAPVGDNVPVAVDTAPEVERIRTAMGPAHGDIQMQEADASMVDRAIDLWTTNAEELLAQIAQSGMGIEALSDLRALEAKNPKVPGGRKTILTALTAKMTGQVAAAIPVPESVGV